MSEADKATARAMEEVVRVAVSTYLLAYTEQIFNNFKHPGSQDVIANGIATAIIEYQSHTGVPIAETIAYNLLDLQKARQ